MEVNNNITDDKLVEGIFSGCTKSFFEIVSKYETKVFNTALHLTNNVEDAEQVLEKVFIALHSKLITDCGKTALFDWLVEHTLNTALETLLEKTDGKEDNDRLLDADFSLHKASFESRNEEFRNTIMMASAALPKSCRLVFVLRDILGYSRTKTSEILGITIFEVQSRLQKARVLLREEIFEEMEDSNSEEVA